MPFRESAQHISYDVILVGSSFATSFFLKKYLEHHKTARVLILEKGPIHSHQWQLQKRTNSSVNAGKAFIRKGIDSKHWNFTIGFGGSSNCWSGCTPRMQPEDFELFSKYQVGDDWPIKYQELEPYYSAVEQIMGISGPLDWGLSSRSTSYPLPPHKLSEPEALLKKAYPNHYYPQPTARPSRPLPGRSQCCASAMCSLCPVDAVFTIQNQMMSLFEDPRVDVIAQADVKHLIYQNNIIKSLIYRKNNQDVKVQGNLFALGANAIFNPLIMLKSDMRHRLIGRRLHEQMGTAVSFDLKNTDNFQGSTYITGQGYMFYEGPHRAEYGACMTEYENKIHRLRTEPGRWRQRMQIGFIVEDLPLNENRVYYDAELDMPIVEFKKFSDYGLKGLAKVKDYAREIAEHIPTEHIEFDPIFEEQGLPRPTESHIQGTVVMGKTKEDSVIDKHLIDHQYRNLLVLGSSAFPTGAPANPTLTLCALSLYAADKLFT